MKLILFIIVTVFGLTACQSQTSSTTTDNPNNHKVIVQEVLQANEYTYLRVKENDKELWLALPTVDAKVGETYYYERGMEMKNFDSKDLNRRFESVLFLEGVSKEPIAAKTENPSMNGTNPHVNNNAMGTTPSKPALEKQEVKIEKTEGCVSIADLFSKKADYTGKTVKVKGKVTKFSEGIMNKNWIHLQDGTDAGGKFDLTVTSADAVVKVGDIVTLEGKIAADKDFGFGYFYEVLMEDAAIK